MGELAVWTRVATWFALAAALCALALSTSVAQASSTGTDGALSVASVCDTGHVFFAKTKFVFHTGLAFGVFHHFIYKPFKAGAFKAGTPGRLKSGIKASLAAAFVYHELKLACKDANNSSLLRPLLTPLNLLVTLFTDLERKLKGGSFSTKDFTSAAGAVTSLGQKSAGLGLPIKDIVTGFSGG
jgi:hypothetical protein